MRTHKIVVDTTSEICPLLLEWADDTFDDLSTHEIIPDAVYVIDRTQFIKHRELVLGLVDTVRFVLTNTHEGSDTLQGHIAKLGIVELVKSGKILLVGGGDMDSSWPCLSYDSFLPKLHDYEENIAASNNDIFTKLDKPYKFLFLNGRGRYHRSYLLERFAKYNLLDDALWTNLDSANAPIHYLPDQYEVDRYRKNVSTTPSGHYAKFDLFDNEWGEIYLTPEPYNDTYFSVVSETVFDYPYSFRTEKIWKPVMMGHPWITVANYGYYRDMHNLGFRTFGHVIDESFDLVDHNMDRITRIISIVKDLCKQDLPEFLRACEDVCKYNQQHLAHMRYQVREEFPNRFFQFLNQHI